MVARGVPTHECAALRVGRSSASLGADVYRHLPIIHSLAVNVPTRNLEALAALPFVQHLSADVRVKKYDEFTQNALSPFGMTEEQIEEVVSDELALNRIKDLVATGVSLPESETRAYSPSGSKRTSLANHLSKVR